MTTSTFLRQGRSVTRSRNDRGQFIRGDLEKKEILRLINELRKIARKVLKDLSNIEYDHENGLGNLIDSTACAVYLDGKLLEDTIEYATPTPTSKGPSKEKPQHYAINAGMRGRDAVNDWFKDHKELGFKHNTLHIVAIAAMHYGYYLEEGLYHDNAQKIKVISGFMDAIQREMESLASKNGYVPTANDVAGVGKL